MVHFVGAGPGATDLITLRGRKLLEEADVILYAGSLVNPAPLQYAKTDCLIYDSSTMTLEETNAVILAAEQDGKTTVRLHTGDPSLYGAIGEQMREWDLMGIDYDITPGVSAFSGAADGAGASAGSVSTASGTTGSAAFALPRPRLGFSPPALSSLPRSVSSMRSASWAETLRRSISSLT